MARVSHHLHALMASARKEKRIDDLVAIIEVSESHVGMHRNTVNGFASATLDLLDGVSKCSRVMSSWNTKDGDHKVTLLRQARSSFMQCIDVSRPLAQNADNRCYIELVLVPAYENLLFVSEEIDERVNKVPFNNSQNPRTTSRDTASKLVGWGALEALREYAGKFGCLVVAYNLADFAALVSKDEAVKAFLLCFQLKSPDKEGNWMLPEMTENPRNVGYLSEAYEEALETWKASQPEQVDDPKQQGGHETLQNFIGTILTHGIGVGIAMALGIAELAAKGILH